MHKNRHATGDFFIASNAAGAAAAFLISAATGNLLATHATSSDVAKVGACSLLPWCVRLAENLRDSIACRKGGQTLVVDFFIAFDAAGAAAAFLIPAATDDLLGTYAT